MTNTQKEIIRVAESYVGITEVGDNRGWISKTFEKAMRAVGFQYGQAWCAYFVETVWDEAIKDEKILEGIKRLFSGSTQKTYKNIKQNGFIYGLVLTKHPQPGDIVIWQHRLKPWQGHAGIYLDSYSTKEMITIEGNTSLKGSREGDGVYRKVRSMTRDGNLKVRGYITTI